MQRLFFPPYRSLLLLGCIFCALLSPLQAAIFYAPPPAKKLSKQSAVVKKKHAYGGRFFEKRIPLAQNKVQQEQTKPSHGAGILGWALFILGIWWLIMAIPIVLGIVFSLPFLWIIGLILALFPIVFVLILILGLLFRKPYKKDLRPYPTEE